MGYTVLYAAAVLFGTLMLGSVLISIGKLVAELTRYYRDKRVFEALCRLTQAAEIIYGHGEGYAKLRHVQEQAARTGLGDVGQDQIEAALVTTLPQCTDIARPKAG